MSGVSKGVVVVEGGLGSGWVVRGGCGVEEGGEVFGLGGGIGNGGREGGEWLIKEGGIVVREGEEIVEKLEFGLEWLGEGGEN